VLRKRRLRVREPRKKPTGTRLPRPEGSQPRGGPSSGKVPGKRLRTEKKKTSRSKARRPSARGQTQNMERRETRKPPGGTPCSRSQGPQVRRGGKSRHGLTGVGMVSKRHRGWSGPSWDRAGPNKNRSGFDRWRWAAFTPSGGCGPCSGIHFCVQGGTWRRTSGNRAAKTR